jgi:head-tail adaptor
MTAGRRDQLIVIERGTATTDDYGGETITWETLAQEWAAVFYGRGDERRQAAMEQGRQPANFQVLANLDTLSVGVKDRITHDGNEWDIVGTARIDRASIEFTAVRAA